MMKHSKTEKQLSSFPWEMRGNEKANVTKARPGAVIVATCFLVMAGIVFGVVSLFFILLGFFVGEHLLWLGVVIGGIGSLYFLVGWGLIQGQPWAWFGTMLSTVPSIALACWLNRVGMPEPSCLAAVLMVGHLVIHLMLWRKSVRTWFCENHQDHARGYDELAVS